jgi:tripartite-type tricarboxylate transporter receptor subunit TctC
MQPILHLIRSAALLGAAALAAAPALAQAWQPTQTIKLVVPWAPGGTTDVIGRVLSEPLAKALGQPVVIDNRAGAGGNIGTGIAVREKPDGTTLILVTSTTQAINPHLYAKLPFDPAKDFTPVVHIGSVPNILVVAPKSPIKSVADLLERARKEPGKLTFASGGNGSSQHIAGAMLESAARIDLLHVPYKGGGPAATDLMAGQVDIMLDTGSMGHIQGGTLRAVAVASAKRIPALPNLPTFAEAGLPGMETGAWYGVMGPAGMPKEVVARLNAELNKILKDPAIVKRLQDIGAQVGGGTPAEFETFAAQELKRYAEVIKQRGVKIE